MNKAEKYYEKHRVIGDLLDKESVCKMLNEFHQSEFKKRVKAINEQHAKDLDEMYESGRQDGFNTSAL